MANFSCSPQVANEGWAFLDAAIYATEAMTSIGYGDFTPTTDSGKAFTVAYALFGTFVFARFLTSAIRARKENQKNRPRRAERDVFG